MFGSNNDATLNNDSRNKAGGIKPENSDIHRDLTRVVNSILNELLFCHIENFT